MKYKKRNLIMGYAFLIALIIFIGFNFYKIDPKHLLYTFLPLLIWAAWMWKTDRI